MSPCPAYTMTTSNENSLCYFSFREIKQCLKPTSLCPLDDTTHPDLISQCPGVTFSDAKKDIVWSPGYRHSTFREDFSTKADLLRLPYVPQRIHE